MDGLLLQVLLSGISVGMIYAVIAFGYQLTFATSTTLNFGQGEALAAAALAAGGRATVLPVAVASHTPLLQGAVAPFAALLESQRWSIPAFPVLSGITAEPVADAKKAMRELPRQIAEPIRWKECMDACVEAGVTVALELGPGGALARMLQARHPHIACRSVTEFRSLDGIHSWLGRQLD